MAAAATEEERSSVPLLHHYVVGFRLGPHATHGVLNQTPHSLRAPRRAVPDSLRNAFDFTASEPGSDDADSVVG